MVFDLVSRLVLDFVSLFCDDLKLEVMNDLVFPSRLRYFALMRLLHRCWQLHVVFKCCIANFNFSYSERFEKLQVCFSFQSWLEVYSHPKIVGNLTQ